MKKPDKDEKVCYNCVWFRSYRDLFYDYKETNIVGICLHPQKQRRLYERLGPFGQQLLNDHIILFPECTIYMGCPKFKSKYKRQ